MRADLGPRWKAREHNREDEGNCAQVQFLFSRRQDIPGIAGNVQVMNLPPQRAWCSLQNQQAENRMSIRCGFHQQSRREASEGLYSMTTIRAVEAEDILLTPGAFHYRPLLIIRR
jgi:hypothetical protein